MIKIFKKVILSSLSVLGISLLIWTLFLLNPSWSYANKTQVDFVTIYHNQNLEVETQYVLEETIKILKNSALYNEDISFDLCLNDDDFYPKLHPLVGQPLGYAIFNKTVLKNCDVSFVDNVVSTKWPINNYEYREFNLTWLLAHEFSHNLQFDANPFYSLGSSWYQINWKLEGHAEYIAREFKDDGLLKSKIESYLLEEQLDHNGLPVFDLEDGTKQIMSYYKYALVVQYLFEVKQMNFDELYRIETGIDELYSEMIEWSLEES